MTDEILHLSENEPQHSWNNSTFPQWSLVTHWVTSSFADTFQNLAKEGFWLKLAATATPEGTIWDRHFMVCNPPTYPFENTPSITHIQTGYEKWPRILGVPSPTTLCLSHPSVIGSLLWHILCGRKDGGARKNNPNSTLSYGPKIMHNSQQTNKRTKWLQKSKVW